jgi:hypothetical protein
MPKTYDRHSPVTYATQRAALAGRVRGGETVEAVARELCIPRSTARLWAAQDGFRLKDFEADSNGAPREEPGNWAKPGRKGRRPAPAAEPEEEILPPADYPGLKGLSARARLVKLSELAAEAQMRAISAIEEGCIGFALSSMREAQRLSRAWRALQDWLEKYPEAAEGDEAAEQDARRRAILEDLSALVEGRTRERRPRTPEQLEADDMRRQIRAAIDAAEAADLERLGLRREDFTPEEWNSRQLDLLQVSIRMEAQWKKWAALPGRGPPQLKVSLPPRRARAGTYVSGCMQPAYREGIGE